MKAVAISLTATTSKGRIQSSRELNKAKQQEQEEKAKVLKKKSQAHKLQKSLSPQKALAAAELKMHRLLTSDKKPQLNEDSEDQGKRGKNKQNKL